MYTRHLVFGWHDFSLYQWCLLHGTGVQAGEEEQNAHGKEHHDGQPNASEDCRPAHGRPKLDPWIISSFANRCGHGDHLRGRDGRGTAVTEDVVPVAAFSAGPCAGAKNGAAA
jgi:hypothetical protein